MDTLKIYEENIADVVSILEPNIGDEFTVKPSANGKPVLGIISQILELRKEKGIYKDESNRRNWFKVKYQLV
jgi:hypothetical protein